MPEHEGKHMLTAILYGGTPPQKVAKSDFVQRLQRASIWYRWLAASLLVSEYEALCADTSKKNPESSILSALYFACEDYVLSSWYGFLMRRYSPKHLSLHFDGVRISAMDGVSAEDLCKQSESHIQDDTTFVVNIKEKKHLTILCGLKAKASEVMESKFPMSHLLTSSGNCIPHALACLGALRETAMEKLNDDAQPDNEASPVFEKEFPLCCAKQQCR